MNEKTKKTASSRSQKKRAALSIFLVVAILITAAFAFLSATDGKTNVFTIGSVDIELWEDFDTDGNGTAETYDASEANRRLSMGNIIPGQTVTKRPYIKNKGNNDAWVYLAVSVPTSATIYRDSINDSVALSATQQEINIKAFAVQDGYGASENDTSAEVYNAYFDAELKKSAFGGVSSENTDEKLFVLNDLNETTYAPSADSKWTLIETYPMNGKVYFVYGYNELLGTDCETDDLFTSVTLNPNIGEVKESDSDTSSGTKEDDIFTSSVVPDGVTITTPDGTVYAEGDAMPEITVGDTTIFDDGTRVETSDYIYMFNRVCTYGEFDENGNSADEWDEPGVNPDNNINMSEYKGWGVRVKNVEKETYGALEQTLNGAYLRFLDYCFAGCSKLVEAPELPKGIISMDSTFTDCESLTKAPNFPTTVLSTFGTFENCSSLKTAPELNENLVTMEYMFINCSSLTTMPAIPSTVVNMEGAFMRCAALTGVTEIPVGVQNMTSTFNECTSLSQMPLISSTVTNMEGTFEGCTSLTNVTAIPAGVENMRSTFCGCTSLTTAPAIPSSVTDVSNTFEGCSALTGSIEVNCNPQYYGYFISGTQITSITGSTTMAAELLATK